MRAFQSISVPMMALVAALGFAGAASAAVDPEVAYIFNTFSFLVCGFLVMFMAAGFAMLESGLVRTKNTATICLKNICIYSVAGLMYYFIGYNLMYTDVSGYIGTLTPFYDTSPAEIAALSGKASDEQMAEVVGNDYSIMSDWFFQMVFVATAASIVSGTVAERVKFWPFFIFVVVLTGFIYPIQGAWTWGKGWLDVQGFSDFAGSTIVHSVGGWAALMGAIIIGARRGKYGPDGSVHPMPGANLPLATLGTFILWLGWFGFNGGSQLALGSAGDATAISNVFVNTNLAAAAGVVAAVAASQAMFGKIDLTMALNGAIGGLVSITAGPDLTFHLTSAIIGAIGGVLVVITVPMLDKMKIDDVVGAIPAHLVCGIWGTLAVAIFGEGTFAAYVAQITGIIAIGLFVSITSAIVWYVLHVTMGLRPTEEQEELGLDRAEVGMEAYPEFGTGSARL